MNDGELREFNSSSDGGRMMME